MQRRLGLTAKQLWMIDWETFENVNNRVSHKDYNIVKKIMWAADPSYTKLQTYGKTKTIECTLCGNPDTPYHFWQCICLREARRWKRCQDICKNDLGRLEVSPILWNT